MLERYRGGVPRRMSSSWPSSFMNWPSVFDDFFDDNFFKPSYARNVEIKETEKNMTYRLLMPDMNKDDFKVELNEGSLDVILKKEDNKEEEKEENGVKYHTKQFSSMNRSWRLPLYDNANTDSIKAAYKNNVLEITMEKYIEGDKKDTSRTIEVE